jgi:arginase
MDGTASEAGPGTAGIALIKAPLSLGLRPPQPGKEPGTWRAPMALAEAGLDRGLNATAIVALPRLPYDFAAQTGTRLRNGQSLRIFNELLADTVATALQQGRFPVVMGGDCALLLGALAGARRFGELALVHIDGHSDFRHPGNYDAESTLSAVAGMDLALATGRGEALMTAWDGRPGPLVPEARVVQIGEREGRDPDWAWRDVLATEITQIDIFWAREQGTAAVLQRAFATLDREPDLPFWVHLDVDVLDQEVMPAVDSPGSPGLDYDEVATLLRGFLASPRCLGLDVTIFDPDLDPDGAYADGISRMLVAAIAHGLDARERPQAVFPS